jgi:outer membrane protein assembly factor BamB
MAKTQPELLVVGVGGYAVAVDPASGSELWRTKLKTTSFVTVLHAGARVYAGAGGELFCLDAATGNVLWHNKLKGLGLGLVSFTSGSEAAAHAALQQQRAAAAAAAAG